MILAIAGALTRGGRRPDRQASREHRESTFA